MILPCACNIHLFHKAVTLESAMVDDESPYLPPVISAMALSRACWLGGMPAGLPGAAGCGLLDTALAAALSRASLSNCASSSAESEKFRICPSKRLQSLEAAAQGLPQLGPVPRPVEPPRLQNHSTPEPLLLKSATVQRKRSDNRRLRKPTSPAGLSIWFSVQDFSCPEQHFSAESPCLQHLQLLNPWQSEDLLCC